MSEPTLMNALGTALERESSIVLAYVFGSVGRGEATGESDVDVAVLAAAELDLETRSRLGEDLARAIGFRNAIDVVDLRNAPPVLAAEVVRDGICILERDRLVRFDFETSAIRRFEDTRPLRRLQHELLREAARGPA